MKPLNLWWVTEIYLFLKIVLVGFRVRFHYGHPDVFDRIFHITRGGISKSSVGINLSEDIFAGSILDTSSVLENSSLVYFMMTIFLHRFQFNTKAWEYYPP